MDSLTLIFFLAAAFFGGLASGLSGFAMGLVVSGVWLHIIAPAQNAMLIVLCGLVTQGSGIWRVRHAISWRPIAYLTAGSALGIPAGTAILAMSDKFVVRFCIGVLLGILSLYGLLRPTMQPLRSSAARELTVGIANGVIGGLTGLGGIAVTLWCQFRGGDKDAQRAIFQPVMFATFLMSAVWLAVAGVATGETLRLYALALPALLAGIWLGIRLYGRLNDQAFRRIVLVLMLASGLSLIVPLR